MAEPDQVRQLIIQYRIGSGGVDDFDKRVRVENLMIECLSREGLGCCDGGDMGNGSMNVFCFVKDVRQALPLVVQALNANGLQDGAVIVASLDDTLEVLWPEGLEGEFLPL